MFAKSAVFGEDASFVLEEDLSLLLPLNELGVIPKILFLMGLITMCTGSFLDGVNQPCGAGGAGGEFLGVGELLRPLDPGIMQFMGGISSGLGDTLMSLPLNLR